MAFWSGEKILAEQKLHPKLVAPFDHQNIDCNAYTLHMGAEFFVTADGKRPTPNTKISLAANQPFVIPPGQFAFLLTKEALDIPANAMAFISMRATFKFQGLINVSGFHVDPGYKGQLVFSVYNAGSNPVPLEEGLPLFLVWFADLDRKSEDTYLRTKAGPKSISNDLLKGMNGEILSLQSLSEKIEIVRRDMAVQRGIFNWAVGLATVFMVTLIIGLAIAFFSNYLETRNNAHTLPTSAAKTDPVPGTVIPKITSGSLAQPPAIPKPATAQPAAIPKPATPVTLPATP